MATQEEVAIHLDISRQWVMSLVRKGILPKSKGRGGHDIDQCRISYINYLRGSRPVEAASEISSSTIDEHPETADYNHLIEQEKYRKFKRENDIAEGLIAPVDLLTEALQNVAMQIAPLLDGITPAMKRANPELTGPDLQIADEQIAKARNTISSIKLKLDNE